MLKKILMPVIIMLAVHQNIFSQEFMHSVGGTISVLSGTLGNPGETSSFSMMQTNFTYFPRYNFIENENSSFSIGAPVGAGIGVVSNTYGGDAGVSFAFDVPVVLDYNLGFKATSESSNYFGGYFGAGFGYYHVTVTGSQYFDFNGTSYGPLVRGGVRIGSSNESWGDHGLTIGIFYKKGLEKEKFNTFGFNVLYDF
jgi:hypothetical protein